MFYPSSIFHQAAAAFRWCPGAQIFSRARLGPSETSGVFNCNENNVNTNHGRALQWLYHIHIYMYSVYIYMHMHLIEMNQKIQNMTELQYVFSFWHWQDLGYCSYAQSPCHFPGAPMEADAGLWWQVLCSVCSLVRVDRNWYYMTKMVDEVYSKWMQMTKRFRTGLSYMKLQWC